MPAGTPAAAYLRQIDVAVTTQNRNTGRRAPTHMPQPATGAGPHETNPVPSLLSLDAAVLQQSPSPEQVKIPSSSAQAALIRRAADQVAQTYDPNTPEYYQALDNTLLRLKEQRLIRPLAVGPSPVSVPPPPPPSAAMTPRQRREELARIPSFYRDPRWQKNFMSLVNERLPREAEPLRIFGGQPAQANDFPDCVSLGNGRFSCCSGTLIGKNVVLTAAHCVRDGCAASVFIGTNANAPGQGQGFLSIRQRIPHPQYDGSETSPYDVALLILDQPVTVKPAPLAATSEIDSARDLQVVGFGLTTATSNLTGVKSKVLLPIGSSACNAPDDPGRYQCNSGFEMVAGGLGYDSCNGDSGGPAYVQIGKAYKLAGVTVRGTPDNPTVQGNMLGCGQGGIYIRVDKHTPWIIQAAKDNGGILAAD
jgi:hypothetical protein